jgi:hypothetical protein
MGVSAVGARGIRPRTVPILLGGALALLVVLVYVFGPPIAPGVRGAAEARCNELSGSNYRSFKLTWVLPQSPAWDAPHWLCKDQRDLTEPGVSFGWWVSPF